MYLKDISYRIIHKFIKKLKINCIIIFTNFIIL